MAHFFAASGEIAFLTWTKNGMVLFVLSQKIAIFATEKQNIATTMKIPLPKLGRLMLLLKRNI
jgi:hypothetical protein